MTDMVEKAGLRVAEPLVNFIEHQVLPGLDITPGHFWQGLAELYQRFAPENAVLLERRDRLQAALDAWHAERRNQPVETASEEARLRDLGYLVADPAPFQVRSTKVDQEVASLAAPQLVVPLLNPRFALNAVNARWGSLYDALYGTDAIPGAPAGADYDSRRGAQVIAWAKQFLDEAVPLAQGRWADFRGGVPELRQPEQLIGRRGESLLLKHHGLHIEVVMDRNHPVGRADPAGIADICLEAALTTIVDLEDSVAAIDAEDKVEAYANWLGLMRGDLEATFHKAGARLTRTMHEDRAYTTMDGAPFSLPGRSLLFVRNVGHLMSTSAILLPEGREAPEGILDAAVTSLIALYDLKGLGRFRNSRAGSVYIVKPKMHGPEEAAFANRLFDAVEDLLMLERHTLKIGVMDEERRTSINLAACIAEVKDRIVFINTGFLDRTGDEIHTAMQAGPMIRKAEMKVTTWIKAYEDRNVQIGLACGLSGRGQIGKGMWAAPDKMADMLAEKIAHPAAGATTAWVPSPTAAVLHATHYHRVDVAARQAERRREAVAPLSDLLTLPLAAGRTFGTEEVRQEVENNVQGILGYVVRWIDQGIGCSKVPDIHEVGLMEDRATLRISSQHLANWLLHGVVSQQELDAALLRMAAKVDVQNAGDPAYRPMSQNPETSLAFQAARALILDGVVQPNGYTEPLLHAYRSRIKAGAEPAAGGRSPSTSAPAEA